MTRSGWRRRAVVLVAVCVAFAALPAGASAKVRVFSFTGAEQRFKIPKGVKKIRVVAIGGRGGRGRGGGPGRPRRAGRGHPLGQGRQGVVHRGRRQRRRCSWRVLRRIGGLQRGCCRRDGWAVRRRSRRGRRRVRHPHRVPRGKHRVAVLPLDRRGGRRRGGSGESGFDGGGAGGAAGASGAPGDDGVNGDPGGRLERQMVPVAGAATGESAGSGREKPAARSPSGARAPEAEEAAACSAEEGAAPATTEWPTEEAGEAAPRHSPAASRIP